ncbi:hypothetical protein, partial [Acinetobacter nosocomialis]|uniref:hypothetical protein n=1 Tax=Acinetobacter nosocomialis TaxID=106654 RepID=UPI001C07FE92
YMRANWLCGRFCVQASSFENYIAEKPFTDRFVQQSLLKIKTIQFQYILILFKLNGLNKCLI